MQISDVIKALDLIIDTAHQERSAIGYFTCLYRKMTIAVQQGIAQHSFEDGNRMEQLDVLFAQRYLQAYNQMRSGTMPTQAWHLAFETAKQNQVTVLQDLLLGINAHINLDLGIAAAQTMEGRNIQDLKKDFDKINQVIANVTGEVQTDLAQIWFPLRFINQIADKSEDAVINFSISIARKSAWQVALDLSEMPLTQQPTYIASLDKRVTILGKTIASPGLKDTLLCKAIKFFEIKDPTKIIDILEN